MLTKRFVFKSGMGILILVLAGFQATPLPTPATARSFIYGGLAWSPDGSQIAVGTDDGVWIHQANALDDVEHVIEANFVTALDWHPTENWIATGSSSSQDEDPLRVWDADTGEVLHVLEGHPYIIDGVNWSPDGHLLATTSWDETLRVWQIEATSAMQIIDTPDASTHSRLDWSPNSRYVVTKHLYDAIESHIVVYDPEAGDAVLSWPFNIETWSIQWSPDNRFIATVGGDGLIRIWGSSTGELSSSVEVDGT
jgi:WD40 repeat protein